MNIPEGYILVPIIPTEEMIGAGQNQEWTEDVYAAMIGAAPFVCESSVEEYDEAKEREMFANAMHEMGRCSSVSGVLDDGGLYYFKSEWEIWQACAKSRARSAE